jgi:hypothetical protein
VFVAETCPEEYSVEEMDAFSKAQTTSVVFDAERGAVVENIHIPDGLHGDVHCIIDFV